MAEEAAPEEEKRNENEADEGMEYQYDEQQAEQIQG